MGFTLQEVISFDEFPAVIDAQREAFKTPFNAMDTMYTPQGLDPTATRHAIIKNQWDQHMKNPGGYWIKVVDSETGKVAGGALWHIYETDPFAGPEVHRVDASWWPQGE